MTEDRGSTVAGLRGGITDEDECPYLAGRRWRNLIIEAAGGFSPSQHEFFLDLERGLERRLFGCIGLGCRRDVGDRLAAFGLDDLARRARPVAERELAEARASLEAAPIVHVEDARVIEALKTVEFADI